MLNVHRGGTECIRTRKEVSGSLIRPEELSFVVVSLMARSLRGLFLKARAFRLTDTQVDFLVNGFLR